MATSTENRRPLGNNEAFTNVCHMHGNLIVSAALHLQVQDTYELSVPCLVKALETLREQVPSLQLHIVNSQMNDTRALQTLHQGWLNWLLRFFSSPPQTHSFKQTFVQASQPKPLPFSIRETDDWQRVLEEEVSTIFDVENESLWRARWVASTALKTAGVLIISVHPSVSDCRGLLSICSYLVQVIESQLLGQPPPPSIEPDIHLPVEALIPSDDITFGITDYFTNWKLTYGFMFPWKSPYVTKFPLPENVPTSDTRFTRVLFAELTPEETKSLVDQCRARNVTFRGLATAAGLCGMRELLGLSESDPDINIKTTQEANLRLYCNPKQKLGPMTTYFEQVFSIPPVKTGMEVWNLARQVGEKIDNIVNCRYPLKLLRVYNNMLEDPEKTLAHMGEHNLVQNEMAVLTIDQTINYGHTSVVNVEKLIYTHAAHFMGSPFSHSLHILNGKMQYILSYHTTYTTAVLAEDNFNKTLSALKMAATKIERERS